MSPGYSTRPAPSPPRQSLSQPPTGCRSASCCLADLWCITPATLSSHRMTLDMKRGALLGECRLLKAPDVGIRLRTLRVVSLSERAVGLQLIQLEIEDGEVEVTLEASFEGVNLGLVSERIDQDLGVWRTQRSGKGLAMATASSLQVDGHDLAATAHRQIEMRPGAGNLALGRLCVSSALSPWRGATPTV